jgi:hypothetical protein
MPEERNTSDALIPSFSLNFKILKTFKKNVENSSNWQEPCHVLHNTQVLFVT